MLAKKCFLVGIITLLSVSLAIADPPAVHPVTGEPLVIDCLRGTPDAIDGDLSDWNLEAMTPAVLDVAEQLFSGQDSWAGPEDCSGEFYLLWDDENIYIAAVVKDDALSMNKTGGDIWNADAVEIFFATTNAVAGHAEHYQYGVNANNQRWNWCNMDGAGGVEPDYLQIASTVTADGYICEASIPYGQMPSLDFSAGNTIGFHPVFDDTDNGDRELQMTWTGREAHDQSLGYGHLFLSSDSAPVVDMEIGFATQPPVLDGEVDEIWADASTQYFVPLDDPANASGSWKVLYDSENLYVLVDMTDDSLQNDSASSWQDDSVEVYFDGGNTKVNTPLSGDDHQYTFGWTTDDIQGTNIDGATEGIEHAQVTTDTGWRIEIKMPWLSIQGAEPQAGDLIGIDCYYNDDDDGGDSRENKLLSFSAVEGWNDASQWGTAMLAAEPEAPSPTVIWVSYHGADDAPTGDAAGAGFTEAPDKGYTDLLKANGYNVTRYITTGTPDVSVLNAADLVIIGRSAASGHYQNDAATAWNATVTAPMIITCGYKLRSSRMGFTTGTDMPDTTGDIRLTVTDPAHPIFAGIPLTDGTMDNPYAGVVTHADGTLARGISINNNPLDDEGIILGTISEASAAEGPVGGVVIAEWPVGSVLMHDGGAGTDTLAGPRMVFLTGSREPDGISSHTAGIIDLYPDGAQMLLNAAKYMISLKAVDVTAPGDAIKGVPDDGDWPGAETPDLAIDDNVETKYLHFKGDFDPDPGTGGTGIQVTPAAGPTIVTGLTLTTANDVAGRDPIAFELSGSKEGIDGPYELIASGDVIDFAGADEWPRFTMNATPISFKNDTAYAHYQLIFTAIRGPVGGSVNSMQIAEVELLGVPGPAGPVAHYKLDEGEGTIAVDSSGNGNDGTLEDGPTVVDGQFGQALALEVSRVAIPASDTLTADLFQGSFTLTAWINPKLTGNTWQQIFRSMIAADTSNDTLFINNDGRLSWRGRVGGAWAGGMCETAAGVVPADQWTHVAVTGDGTNFRIYVNGVLSQESAFQTTDGSNATYYIGGDPPTTGESYSGMADEVRIYDRALSADEVSELAVKAVDPSLVIYYSFDDVGEIVADQSGKGHDGVVIGEVTAEPEGMYNGAANFASGSYLDLDGASFPAEDIPTSAMTLAAWIKIANTGGDHEIFNARASDESWVIHPEPKSSGDIRWLLRSYGGTTIFEIRAGTITWDEWLHFAGTYDKETAKAALYINGELIEEMDVASPADIAGDWGLGARVGLTIDNARPFTGLMDEFRMYTRALSQDEILTIMQGM